MAKYRIQGGKKLSGTIRVAGNKNAVLPIMAASLLCDGDVTLSNIPKIQDVSVMADILMYLGAQVTETGEHDLVINTKHVTKTDIPHELSGKLRASVLLMGPLFSRFGKVTMMHPGGDIIGKRSIRTHLDVFSSMGATIHVDDEAYTIETSSQKSNNCSLFLDEPSVTGTENAILASVVGKGMTTIGNCAKEPHILDLIKMLNSSGASITGTQTGTIVIEACTHLNSYSHTICPDYLEAGTFAVLGAITHSPIVIEQVPFDDLRLPLLALCRMGGMYKQEKDRLTIIPSELVSTGKRIQAGPHPQFPTDLMSPFIVLASQALGETLFHDPMYESRMFFVDKLIRMGAQITICDPHRVIVNGKSSLSGRKLASPDIRAGMSLVLAALIAQGESEIDLAEIVERGYERLDERLQALGADIVREE